MYTMFKQFFSMFTVLFSAGEHGAKALENVAHSAEIKSEVYLNKTRHEYAKQCKQMELELLEQDSKTIN